ncbi:MAG: ribosome silencing factor [Bacilli bacterium]
MEPITIIKQIIEQLKLKNVCIYETKQITPFFDFALLATASSQRQLKASIDHLQKESEQKGLNYRNIEGKNGGLWVLVDFGSVVVHVFTKEERERFDIDKLWKDLLLEQIEE